MDWRSRATTPWPANSFGSRYQGSGQSDPPPPTTPLTRHLFLHHDRFGSSRVFLCPQFPRHHDRPLAKCGCKKFMLDFHRNHRSKCTDIHIHICIPCKSLHQKQMKKGESSLNFFWFLIFAPVTTGLVKRRGTDFQKASPMGGEKG
jgi:hypothetical protein